MRIGVVTPSYGVNNGIKRGSFKRGSLSGEQRATLRQLTTEGTNSTIALLETYLKTGAHNVIGGNSPDWVSGLRAVADEVHHVKSKRILAIAQKFNELLLA